MRLPFEVNEIFSINSNELFNEYALKLFQFQYENNQIYRQFVDLLKVNPLEVTRINRIPFLPVEFFKSNEVISTPIHENTTLFLSSGTTKMSRSHHYVNDITLYEQSFMKGFHHFYGNIEDYVILALLPSYLEQGNSSLVYMVDHLIQQTNNIDSGFYLYNHDELVEKINSLKDKNQKTILIGVTYALLDLIDHYEINFPELIVMETGGMKGRRKELIKEELHEVLKDGFHVSKIHSEYGMSELLSQGYSLGNGKFSTPPWMKILLREVSDPFDYQVKSSGVINVIDLANIHSCAFLATQDIGKMVNDSEFTVLGRTDYSEMRGCNLMLS